MHILLNLAPPASRSRPIRCCLGLQDGRCQREQYADSIHYWHIDTPPQEDPFRTRVSLPSASSCTALLTPLTRSKIICLLGITFIKEYTLHKEAILHLDPTFCLQELIKHETKRQRNPEERDRALSMEQNPALLQRQADTTINTVR